MGDLVTVLTPACKLGKAHGGSAWPDHGNFRAKFRHHGRWTGIKRLAVGHGSGARCLRCRNQGITELLAMRGQTAAWGTTGTPHSQGLTGGEPLHASRQVAAPTPRTGSGTRQRPPGRGLPSPRPASEAGCRLVFHARAIPRCAKRHETRQREVIQVARQIGRASCQQVGRQIRGQHATRHRVSKPDSHAVNGCSLIRIILRPTGPAPSGSTLAPQPCEAKPIQCGLAPRNRSPGIEERGGARQAP